MSGLYRKESMYVSSEEEGFLPFFEHLYTKDIFVTRRIAKLFLPEKLYEQFVYYQNQQFSQKFKRLLEKALGRPITVSNRPIANFGPKYYEYKIYFEGDMEKDEHVREVYGFGQSLVSQEEALSKAYGEFLERYFLTSDWNQEAIRATVQKLGRKAVPLSDCPVYLPWQKKKVSEKFVTKDTLSTATLSWLKAKSLWGIQKKYIPTQRILWMHKRAPDENILNQPTSNGNGAGFTQNEAILSALYELIERDGFMCYWLLKRTPEHITVDTVTTPGILRILPLLKRYTLEVTFFNFATSLGVPTIACIVIDRSDQQDPKISFGAASGYNPQKLFDASFLEALVVQRYHWANEVPENAEHLKAIEDGLFDNTSFDHNNMDIRLQMWRGRTMEDRLSFLFGGKRVSFHDYCEKSLSDTFNSREQELHFIKKLFQRQVQVFGAGYHPYIYTVKQPILARLNFHVLGICIPALFPLYLAEHMSTLDISNMQHWKIQNEELVVQNNYHHPFP